MDPFPDYGTAVLHGGPCDGRHVPILGPPPKNAKSPVAQQFGMVECEHFHIYHQPLTDPDTPRIHHYQYLRSQERGGG